MFTFCFLYYHSLLTLETIASLTDIRQLVFKHQARCKNVFCVAKRKRSRRSVTYYAIYFGKLLVFIQFLQEKQFYKEHTSFISPMKFGYNSYYNLENTAS